MLIYIVMIIFSFAANHPLVDISSYVKGTVVLILDLFFTERIVNPWNTLPPDIVKFNSVTTFKRSIKLVDISGLLECFNHSVFFFSFV